MKPLMALSFILLTVPTEASKLQVGYSTRKAVLTTTYTCTMIGTDLSTQDRSVESTRPGSISLRISGGTPPYAIHWHTALTHINDRSVQVMPGRHAVTVVDANGERVTRTVHVGVSRRTVRMSCTGEVDAGVEAKGTPHIVRPSLTDERKMLQRRERTDRMLSERASRPERSVEHSKKEEGTERRPVRVEPARR